MRLLTYLFAAALLWAIAATGPATSEEPAQPARASAAAQLPRAGASVPAYPR